MNRCSIIRAGMSVGLLLALAGTTLGQAPPPPPPLPPVPVPLGNPITENKRVLGKILYWEEQLSSTNTMSCGSCHTPGRAGAEGRAIATDPGLDGVLGGADDKHASGGVVRSDAEFDFLRDPVYGLKPQVTSRASPVAIMAAYAPTQFWDGRATGQFRDPITNAVVLNANASLESQAAAPPQSAAEMGHDGINWVEVEAKLSRVKPLDYATNMPPDVQSALAGVTSYSTLFQRAFGDGQVTAARAIMAIATYERTLIANQSPFDSFINNVPGALTQAQQRGWGAFNASNCNVCHAGPLLTGQGFRNIGLRPVAEDTGRQAVTGDINDRGRFKVPTLRNVGLKQTFMHNGQFTTLADLILFYARAPGAAPQFADNRDPVMLTVNVPPVGPNGTNPRADMEEFLRTALTDPRVRDQTFPFDKPTLTAEIPARATTMIAGTGVAGSGGGIAKVLADMPPKLSWSEFRVGVDGWPLGTNARLVASLTAPAGGVIPEDAIVGDVTVDASGLATLHTKLGPDRYAEGQVVYMQWVSNDPTAPGGKARSEVARLPIFCGSGGCPVVCAADIVSAGGAAGKDGQATVDDLIAYLSAFFAGDLATADKASLGGTHVADGLITVDDIVVYLSLFFTGCP